MHCAVAVIAAAVLEIPGVHTDGPIHPVAAAVLDIPFSEL
jgi:hypothetical protein